MSCSPTVGVLGDAPPINCADFPGGREKCREFRRFSRFLRESVSETSVDPGCCERIPCAIEQGIILREQGIISASWTGAGNLAQNRSPGSNVRFRHNTYQLWRIE